MAKDKITEYDATANNNTVCGDVNIAENSALPSDMNNFAREIMSHLKEGLGSGTPLYVDQTNNRVGINKTPTVDLDVSGSLSVDGGTIKLDGNYPVGTDNVALGNTALNGSLTGGYNTAMGSGALAFNTTASNNTAVGYLAGQNNTTGTITAVGAFALLANTTGTSNVGIGGFDGTTASALRQNTTGNQNTAVGVGALQANTTASQNTAVGYQALSANTTGLGNSAVGDSALDANTTGAYNVAFGVSALSANTTADSNVAIGTSALEFNTTGTSNTAVGTSSLDANTTGNNNTAIGLNALGSNTTGSGNTALGRSALPANTTASANTAVGYATMNANTTGASNTAIGEGAGFAITTGSNNICIGAGSGEATVNLTTGANNIYIGTLSRGSASANGQEIVLGYNTTGKGTNTGFINPNGGGVYQGNNSSTWSTTSDERIKKNIVDNTTGLDAINQVQVRNFEYRTEDEITELPTHSAIDKQGVQLGVIAQEIQTILPDMVKEESTGVLSVNPDNMTWYLVNAVKELSAKNDALEARLATLEGE